MEKRLSKTLTEEIINIQACLSLSKNCHSMFFGKNLWKSLKSTSVKKHTCLLFVMKQFCHAALNTSNSFIAFSSLLKNTVQEEFVLYGNQLNELPWKSVQQFHYNARFCWMEFRLLFKIYLKESKLFIKATETCTICCPLNQLLYTRSFNPWNIVLKEILFNKVAGFTPSTQSQKHISQIFFKGFDQKFRRIKS